MAGPDDKNKKGEEILHILKKGTEFTHELLEENERLRYRLAQLMEEADPGRKAAHEKDLHAEVTVLQKKLESLETEKSGLLERFKEVEEENRDFANRYVEIEKENNVLANLYVASYQLHSTLDFNEVLGIILEIIINLIGGAQFAILLLDEKTHQLTAVASEGIEKKDIPTVTLAKGPIGKSAKSGDSYYRKDVSQGSPINSEDPLVCIPMKIKERVIGVITIYSLLQQKDKFTNLDYELFGMLAGHSATAIFSSKLYSESERKLSTIQGFIDLLTK
jgi:nitrate/nitrite-specific signal transduction histidine kinase